MAEQTTTLRVVARDDASAVLSRISSGLSGLGRGINGLNSGGLSRIGEGLRGLATGVGTSLMTLQSTAIFGGALAAVAQMTMMLQDASTSVSQLSNRFGVGTEQIQVFGDLIKTSGGNVQNAATALNQLAISMQTASRDPELAYAFRQVGLSVQDLQQMDPVEVLRQMSEAFANPANTNELAKQAILMKTMGQDGSYFLNTLNQGPDAYNQKLQEMRAEGTLLSQNQLQTARSFSKAWSDVGEVVESIKLDFGLSAAQALLPVLQQISGYLKDPEQSASIREALRSFAESLPALAQGVFVLIRGFVSGLSMVGQAVQWIEEHFGSVGVAIAGLMPLLLPLVGPVFSIVAGVGRLVTMIPSVVTALGPVLGVLGTIGGVVGRFAPLILGVGTAFAGIVPIVATIAGGVLTIYRNWDSIVSKVKEFGSSVWNALFGDDDDQGRDAAQRAAGVGYDPYAAARTLQQRDARAEARVRVEVESRQGSRAVIREVSREGNVELDASQGLVMCGGD